MVQKCLRHSGAVGTTAASQQEGHTLNSERGRKMDGWINGCVKNVQNTGGGGMFLNQYDDTRLLQGSCLNILLPKLLIALHDRI